MAGKDGERDDYRELIPLFERLADPATPEPERRRIREQLVTGHLPVAEHIARKFRNRGQADEDLRQVARIGLINAVDRFDPGRGTDFLSFAVPTITGEVRRYFRDATWAVRVPRRLKELHAAISAASARLSQELGRSPRPKEIAAALSMPVEEVYEGLQAGFAYHTDSLDSGTDDDGHSPVESRLGEMDGALDLVEDREALIPALATLPEREASIVVLRFFGNLTQTQIADRIGISQMHVSRLLSASLAQLRAVLMADPPDS
ncbi:MAG TPA: SigB/SigF/SigG family RNA polymerase sigma factor [Pseudonocardiaceae bacterium]|nr:SigB/SigF/SigG family RNA polymerase sigma factor [Pseudonocardiaceae bacterium]